MKRFFAVASIGLIGCVSSGGTHVEITEEARTVEPAAPPNPAVQRTCGNDTLVMLEGNALAVVTGAGERRELFRFGASRGLGEDGVVVNTWDVKGGFVGGWAFLYNPPSPHAYEYLLMDLDGRVLFHLVREEPFNPETFLSADGRLAISGDENMVVRPDGAVVPLGRFWPFAAPIGNVVPVADGQPWGEGSVKGFFDLPTGTFTALPVEPLAGHKPMLVDEKVAYLGRVGDDIVLVLATPGAHDAIIIGSAAEGTYWQLVEQAGGRHFLVAEYNSQQLKVVDARTRGVMAVAGTEGRVRYESLSASVEEGGSLVASFLDGERLQLRRTVDGSNWIDVGESVEQGFDFGMGSWLRPISRGGNVFIMGLSTGYGHFLNNVQLVSPQVRTRVTVGGLYVNVDMNPGAADLSDDGQCAATWVQQDGTVFEENARFDLVLLDAAGGQRTVLSASRPAWFRFAR